MAAAPGNIDVDHHDLARLAVDEQVAHGSELTTTYRFNFPTSDVGLALGDAPIAQAAQRGETFRLPSVRSDAGRVAAVTIALHLQTPLEMWRPRLSARRRESSMRGQRR